MIYRFFFVCLFMIRTVAVLAQSDRLSIDGFQQWVTGHDANTIQLIPTGNNNALTISSNDTLVHVQFKVKQYGEVSFSINADTPVGTEAIKTNLNESKFIIVTYQSNQELVLQLRQTGVHGGVHNHIVLPRADKMIERKIYFVEFKGGMKPLDLSDVAKFNFAFLSNNEKDGYAELTVKGFLIDNYNFNQ
jgi:hypothetical protein